jgi:ferredoxin
MKIKRKIIEIDDELCNGCGQCVTGCAEAALQVIDGKARLVWRKNFVTALAPAWGNAPQGP